MTRGRVRSPAAVAVFGKDGLAGAAGLAIDGFCPVRSRWTWQPRLPELWLREQERLHFRETANDLKKKV
jgi:hypothetical protein